MTHDGGLDLEEGDMFDVTKLTTYNVYCEFSMSTNITT